MMTTSLQSKIRISGEESSVEREDDGGRDPMLKKVRL